MSDRLYRNDSFLTRFTARVTGSTGLEPGLFAVELDRTAFYPTGGGQPHDTGRIGGFEVIDVREAGDGRILHDVRAEAPPSGEIEGTIDWDRRFDHMQQHSGQHVLSRAFVEVAGAPTDSFHLGESACTIDIKLGEPDGSVIQSAEARANAVIFGDFPVAVESVPQESVPPGGADARDLALMPGDPVRIVSIGEFDRTPCGGTHVSRSGQIGAVAIRRWERFKGGTRVSFVCGRRVVGALHHLGGTVDACVERLSAPPEELPSAVDRLRAQVTDARREIKRLTESLARAEAEALSGTSRAVGSCRVVSRVFRDRGAEEIALLARACAGFPGTVALLAAGDPVSGKTSLVFARSEEGSATVLRMGEILSAVCASRGGKGGGGASLARGGGIPAGGLEGAIEEACGMIATLLGAR